MKTVCYAFALFFFLIPSLCFGGPFGAEMGDNPEKYIALGAKLIPYQDKYGNRLFETVTMPKKHSLFISYTLSFGDNGLCHISAGSNDTTKEEFDYLLSQLEKKYGRFILKDEALVWEHVAIDNIRRITLRYAKTVYGTFLFLYYDFDNSGYMKMEKADSDAL